MAFTLWEMNLVFQVVILAILLIGFAFKRRGKFLLHGATMLVVVVLNFVSFLLVMGPSLRSLEPSIVAYPLYNLSLTAVAHGILGALAEVLGILLVVSWGLRKDTQRCVGKRKVMRVTLVLWVVALLLGIFLYAALYTTLLPIY